MDIVKEASRDLVTFGRCLSVNKPVRSTYCGLASYGVGVTANGTVVSVDYYNRDPNNEAMTHRRIYKDSRTGPYSVVRHFLHGECL